MTAPLSPFTVSAEVYDLIYRRLPYDEQAQLVLGHVRRLAPMATSLLDVGCGTGQFLARWCDELDVAGLDVSTDMLALARNRLPGVALHAGDMRDFDFGRTFDAVVCLFSSIGYMTTRSELRHALVSMRRHLNRGGVLVIDPWFSPEAAVDGFVAGSVESTDETVVSRVSYSSIEGRVSVTDMHHVVARRGAGIDHYVERHRMGLFSDDEYAALLAELGFTAELVDDVAWQGRSRWVGALS